MRSILEAAALVFAEGGYARATTNRIAERAGVSIGSLYQYFADKGEILARLLAEHQAEMRPLIEGAIADLEHSDQSLDTGLRAFLQRSLAVHRRNPRLMRVLAEQAPALEAAGAASGEASAGSAYGARIAAALARRPDVQLVNPHVAARVFSVAAEALTRWLAHGAPEEEPGGDFQIEECVRLLAGYLAGPQAAVQVGLRETASEQPTPESGLESEPPGGGE